MMHYLRLLFCLIPVAWLFASCNTDLPLPDASSAQKIVLLGELTAGDTMLFRAGQSIPLASGGPGPQLIQDLSVSVKDGSGVTTPLLGAEDALSYTMFTIPFSNPAVIQPGNVYQVAAKHPRLGEVTAAVNIPTQFTASVKAGDFTNYNGDSVLRFDIEFSDANAAGAHYVIEAVKQPLSIYGYFLFDGNDYSIDDNRRLYDSLKAKGIVVPEHYDTSYSGIFTRQQMYTTDAASENLAGASPGRLFRRIFLSGKSLGGTTHRTEIMIPRTAIYGEPGQYAQTVVYVKSVAADYYAFLKAYDQYDPAMGLGSNASPVKLTGNVVGGFGMIGGVYRWRFGVIY